MIKKLMAVILCFFLLTGCFDRKELNQIGIVVAFALDKDTFTNEIIVSCEVVRPYVLKQGVTGGSPIEIVTAKGSTIFDAIRNISKKLDRKCYFAHNKVIIISEKLAEEGVAPILDNFARNPEIRLLVWIVIAKDTEAKTLLGMGRGLDQIHAFYLNDMIKTKWATSEIQIFDLLDFYKKLLKSGISPTTGAIGVTKEFNSSEISLLGTAAFNKDKLVGYLNYKESRGLGWITGEVKSGSISVPGITKKDEMIAIEIKRSKSKIIPQIKDGEISFLIEVNVLSNIGEIHDLTDISELKILSKLETEEKKIIEEEIRAAINKAKNDFHSDIFGFGNTLSRYYPPKWEMVKDNWDNLFLDSSYELNIKVRLQRSGQIQKPFEPKK